jgi:hypothetical protein
MPQDSPSFFVNDSGWLEASQPVLWLPPERRGPAIASSGQRIVVGSLKGALTILDLPCKPGYSLIQHGAQLKNLLQLNRIPRRSKDIFPCCLSQGEEELMSDEGLHTTYRRVLLVDCSRIARGAGIARGDTRNLNQLSSNGFEAACHPLN